MNKYLQSFYILRGTIGHLKLVSTGEQEALLNMEKAAKVLDVLKDRGIALVIPDNEFSNEHLTIEIYKKTLSKEDWEFIKEAVL